MCVPQLLLTVNAKQNVNIFFCNYTEVFYQLSVNEVREMAVDGFESNKKHATLSGHQVSND